MSEQQPNLFDPVTPAEPRPEGSLTAALHAAEQFRAGRLAAEAALATMEAEVSAFVECQRRVIAARHAEVTGSREGKVRRDPAVTSAQAARIVAPRSGSQRARVLAMIVERGGATDHELAEHLRLLPNSIRPRRGELIEGGYVRDSGRVRRHRGSDWVVWEPTADGLAWWRRSAGGAA